MFRAELASALLFLVEVFSGLILLGGLAVVAYASLQPDWVTHTVILGAGLAFSGLCVLALAQVGKAVVHIATTNDQILAELTCEPEAEQSTDD